MKNEIYIAQFGNPLNGPFWKFRLGGESQTLTVETKSNYVNNTLGNGSGRVFGLKDGYINDYQFDFVQYFDDSMDIQYFKSVIKPGVVREVFGYSYIDNRLKTYYNLAEVISTDQELSGRMQEKSIAFKIKFLKPFWIENDKIELVDLQATSGWFLGTSSLGTTTILNDVLLDGAIGIQNKTLTEIRPFVYSQNDRYAFIQREQLLSNTLRVYFSNLLIDSVDLTTASWTKNGTFTVSRNTTNLDRFDRLNQHFTIPFPATAFAQIRQDTNWTKVGSDVYAEFNVWVKGTAGQQIRYGLDARDAGLSTLNSVAVDHTFDGTWQNLKTKLNITNSNTAFVRWYLTNANFGAVTFECSEPNLTLNYSSNTNVNNLYAPTITTSGVYYPDLSGSLYYILTNNNLQEITTQPLDLSASAKNQLFVIIKGSLAVNNTLLIYNGYSGIKLTWLGSTENKIKHLDIDTLRLYDSLTGELIPVNRYKLEIINQNPFYLKTNKNSITNLYFSTFEFIKIQKNTSANLEIIFKNIKKQL